MPLSRSMEELLAQAAETSLVDDEALVLLGRHVLAALIVDPETPEPLKSAAARMLQKSEATPSVVEGHTPDGAHD